MFDALIDRLAVLLPDLGVRLAVDSSGGVAPFTFVWKKNGSVIPGENQSSYAISSLTESDSGWYTVEVSDSGVDVSAATVELMVAENVPSLGWAGLGAIGVLLAVVGMRWVRRSARGGRRGDRG